MPVKRAASFIRLIAVSKIATLGAALTTTAVLADLLVVLGEIFFFESHPYIGIVTHMMLPGMFLFGLAMIPIGVGLRLRKAHKGYSLAAVDRLAEARKVTILHVLQVVFTLTMLNIVIMALAGYRAFHYTESVAFCGTLCHEVMHPEYETYSRSPHSQIACVKCHIGPGAQWFVKSKLSGARQLVAVVANTYSRPIETPVHNLRPARDVCEVCHRPDIFHGNLMRVIQHFEPDEANTRTFTVLNMRVGGGDQAGGDAHGIHWHVSRSHQVRYYATDRKRENIAWVEQVDADGTRRVWTNPDDPVETPDEEALRVMDCVDCHNRPTHIYLPPGEAMDQWLSTDRLDASIPWIRAIGHELLTVPYATSEEASAGIATLPELYAERYPEHWATHADAVRGAVPALQEIHHAFVFPEMNIQWNTYNSLIGHATPHTQACFRCHNGVLRDEVGEPISLDCRSCHFVLADRETSPRILDRLVVE